ncbi:SDR family NAD(P)-dependent oxidoreductase [Rhodoligotrophos ferricapiens]|uniref:SDR family NAD(P)-dependent oxidoreductase n=1 Tax=Rhodoligotrophos ferricapiens TaxID=3069264 RepID=UPI00315CF79D
MTMEFSGRTAIITGASGTIGSATARTLLDGGARVCLADQTGSSEAAALAATHAGQVIEIEADVTDSASIRTLASRVEAEFGRIDILVNVAGITSHGAAAQLAEAEWDRVIDINLKGTFLCCQAVIPAMRRQGYGRIINIGSLLGKNGGNARPWMDRTEQERSGNIAYGISKAGVHALTIYLARELAADGITVNAVAPGPVASAMTAALPDRLKQMIPVGRMGTGADVARAIAFLAAEEASFITGEILDVNGGMWGD